MTKHLSFFYSTRSSLVIGLGFMSNSLLFGSWVTCIPSVKDAISLSEADLGLALLGAPVGALFIIPFSGWIISRLQLEKAVWLSAIIHSLSLPLLSPTDSWFWLWSFLDSPIPLWISL